MEHMDDMIGYCGLNCRECDAYIATVGDDWELRKKTAKLWAGLNDAPILPEHMNCEGCRRDGVKTVFCEDICDIRRCAMKKDVSSRAEPAPNWKHAQRLEQSSGTILQRWKI